MYKKIILLLGLIVSLMAIAVFTLLQLPEDSDEFASLQEELSIDDTPKQTKITYKTAKKPKVSASNPKERVNHHRYLARATSSNGKYAIILDSDNEGYLKNPGGYTPLYGKIEGASFKIMVPKSAIKNYGGDIIMEVHNLKTGTTQSVSASFVGSMAQGKTTQIDKIDIPDGNNPGNLVHNQENSILPPL